ncbi:gem nuclear organelle associated protein rigor mortis [Calliopsis andreniformis]|uniref:gem nuclear organelle associated protein rigor mortis n=1 Tax=Calliopsis andreniformis TaxID=337506 RepID=UPI003FCEA594
MNEATLPPSPNWYLSNVLVCSFNGTIAWGARNTIVATKHNENNKSLHYSIIKNAHKDRITCLAFTPSFEQVNSNLIASTGEDNTVKVWNLETLLVTYTYSLEPDKQVIGVDWSYKEPFVTYFACSNGTVFSWNVYFNTVSSISLGKVSPTCIRSCPHDAYLVAIGSKNGLIYIVNFQRTGKIVYRLRGHDTEIISLSWCPAEENIISENLNKDFLLASGGKDKSVFIWKAGGDGRYEMTITLPSGPLDSRQHRSKLNASVGNWIVVHWIKPKLLLTSSFWGELLSWDLSIMTKGKPTCKLIHAYHSRGLFCIAHVSNFQENITENWRIKERLTIWTTAQDRRVICCGIKENNVELDYDIYTQGGYVYCIAACPLDTSLIAFGVGDAMLRLWNLSEAHDTSFSVTALWQKIKGKIRAISWHPEKENLLAYATEEGRVGIFDTNCNKPPILYRQYHRGIVYTVSWGPSPENKQFVLYSCAEGELVFYDPGKPNQVPTSILKRECTEFSWKPDFSCLAVGFENGSISFLNHKFKMRGYVKLSSVMVHCLAWHPDSTAADTNFSPLKNYLAVAFKSRTIQIINLSNFMDHLTTLENLTENDDSKERDSYKVNEVVATLTGHIHDVVCLAWSPYISGRLISGSYDHTAQVWNVETQELIATYKEHCGPILCCMWSPLDPNYIITGSADFTLRIWKINSNSAILPQETADKKSSKKTKKKQNKGNKINDVTVENAITDLANTISECSISDAAQTVQKPKVKEVKKKKIEKTTYFSKTTKPYDKTVLLNSLVDIVRDAKSGNESDKGNQIDTTYHVAPIVFSTKEEFMSFFTNERYAHIAENRYNTAAEMDMWSDNLKQSLEEAAKQQRLNDFLISLSASLSMKTWKEMCELYAYQLINEGHPCKAVSYLLCIHKTYKAIEVLQDANLFKEAYALARYKLEPDDPVLTNVLQDWAQYSTRSGDFEQAAYIYAKLGQYSEIVKYLTRRTDAVSLITAAEIAFLCDDKILSKSLAEEAIVAALTQSEYDLTRSIIAKFPDLKYQEVRLLVIEELEKVIEKNVKSDTIQMWLNGESNYGLLETLKTICNDCNCYYTDLCQSNVSNVLKTEQMLWVTISHDMSKAIASSEKEQQLKHVVAVLGTITQFETLHRKNVENQYNLLIEAVVKLDAKSPLDEGSIYAKTDYPISLSLRAYLCYALLTWLVDNVNEESVDNNIQTFIDLLKNLIEDALNQRTLKLSCITNDINKLENEVASTLSKTQESTDDQHTESCIQELEALKAEKKQLFDELVCVPNPIMVYSKANELASKLLDETIKAKFLEIVSKAWVTATS